MAGELIGSSLLTLTNFGIIAGIGVLLLITTIVLVQDRLDLKKKYPEALVIMQSDKKKKPIIEVIDATNQRHTFLATKKEKNDYRFDTDIGLQVDPNNLVKVESERLTRGQPVYRWSPDFYAPVGIRGTRAILTLRDYVRKSYKCLDFITDDLTINHLCLVDDDAALMSDCESVITQYKQYDDSIEMDADELKTTILDIKEKIPTMELKPGHVSFGEAIKLLPIGVTALDIKQIEQKVTSLNMQTKVDDFKKYAIWAFVGTLPIAIMVLGYMIIKSI